MSENPDVNELTDSFKLIVEQEVATPTVQLQWCVEPELVNFLSEKEIDNAQLLIIKHPRDERKEDREIVPLDKMMHYLQLNSAGDVNIMATVVWPQHQSDIEDIEDTLLEQDPYGGYENSIIDRDGGLYDSSSFSELEINQFVSERTLSVPSELFASEPPEWEQQWVNAMFENPPMDQCQYRKRRLLAYSLQPIVYLFAIAITSGYRFTLFLAATFMGYRNTWKLAKSIFQPLQHETKNLWNDGSESIYFSHPDWDKERYWLIKVFNPVTLVSSFVGVTALFALTPLVQYASWVLVGILTPLLPISVYGVKTYGPILLGRTYHWFSAEDHRKLAELSPQERKRLKKKRKRQNIRKRYSALACNGGGDEPDLSSLPEEKQTIKLRFQELKRKVCKPFQH